MEANGCSYCGIAGTDLSKCPCLQVQYCNVECQRGDWGVHKKVCTVASGRKKPKSPMAPSQNSQSTTQPSQSSQPPGKWKSMTQCCTTCGTSSPTLFACPCGDVLYCNRNCQTDDWGSHRKCCTYHKTKKEGKKEKEKENEKVDVKARVKQYEDRIKDAQEVPGRREQRRAALCVQRVGRGMCVRGEVAEVREVGRGAAAVKIQSLQRQRMARRRVEEVRAGQAAASTLSSSSAPSSSSSSSSCEEAPPPLCPQTAAIRIQSLHRGNHARTQTNHLKACRTSTLILQRVCRGYLSRLLIKQHKQIPESQESKSDQVPPLLSPGEAAVRIQALHRGRSARREVEEKKGAKEEEQGGEVGVPAGLGHELVGDLLGGYTEGVGEAASVDGETGGEVKEAEVAEDPVADPEAIDGAEPVPTPEAEVADETTAEQALMTPVDVPAAVVDVPEDVVQPEATDGAEPAPTPEAEVAGEQGAEQGDPIASTPAPEEVVEEAATEEAKEQTVQKEAPEDAAEPAVKTESEDAVADSALPEAEGAEPAPTPETEVAGEQGDHIISTPPVSVEPSTVVEAPEAVEEAAAEAAKEQTVQKESPEQNAAEPAVITESADPAPEGAEPVPTPEAEVAGESGTEQTLMTPVDVPAAVVDVPEDVVQPEGVEEAKEETAPDVAIESHEEHATAESNANTQSEPLVDVVAPQATEGADPATEAEACDQRTSPEGAEPAAVVNARKKLADEEAAKEQKEQTVQDIAAESQEPAVHIASEEPAVITESADALTPEAIDRAEPVPTPEAEVADETTAEQTLMTPVDVPAAVVDVPEDVVQPEATEGAEPSPTPKPSPHEGAEPAPIAAPEERPIPTGLAHELVGDLLGGYTEGATTGGGTSIADAEARLGPDVTETATEEAKDTQTGSDAPPPTEHATPTLTEPPQTQPTEIPEPLAVSEDAPPTEVSAPNIEAIPEAVSVVQPTSDVGPTENPDTPEVREHHATEGTDDAHTTEAEGGPQTTSEPTVDIPEDRTDTPNLPELSASPSSHTEQTEPVANPAQSATSNAPAETSVSFEDSSPDQPIDPPPKPTKDLQKSALLIQSCVRVYFSRWCTLGRLEEWRGVERGKAGVALVRVAMLSSVHGSGAAMIVAEEERTRQEMHTVLQVQVLRMTETMVRAALHSGYQQACHRMRLSSKIQFKNLLCSLMNQLNVLLPADSFTP